MKKISKNVLSDDLSPYLNQHKNNPVNWQIWSNETIAFARLKKNQFYLVLDMQAVIGVM